MKLYSKVPILRRMSAPAATFALALGILIWMKLRLVTGLPRSVYAEPEPPMTTPPRVISVDTASQDWRPPVIEQDLPPARLDSR